MPEIEIDGVKYPLLSDDMTLDEAGWFYEIAGVGPEALDAIGEEFNPKVTKALICLTIGREKPEVPHREIEERIGSMQLTELEQVFAGLVDESPPEVSSASEHGGEALSSGEPSSAASADSPDEADLLATGFRPSDTGAPSDPVTSAPLRRVN